MKLPQTFILAPIDVREAVSEWVSKHKLDPNEPLQIVHITVAWHSDGSVTAMFDHPIPTMNVPPENLQ